VKQRILIVFGTRPEAIKMVPLIVALRNHETRFEVKVCSTGQHKEMLLQVLELFGIALDYDLEIMHQNQTLTSVTTRILEGMAGVLESFNPELVCVHGDTTTTLSAALSCFYHKIPVAHVEAGLRTHNLYSPWPEEANRRLVGHLAALHFAPTSTSAENLMAEGINQERIFVTGNTVIDTLLLMIKRITSDPQKESAVTEAIRAQGYRLNDRKMVLITGHRRENFGSGFENMCQAIHTLALRYPEVDFVYPVHLNPNVREPVQRLLKGVENVMLIEPLGYELFVYMMHRSYLILTDSGGVQEEAPTLGKPVLVMRDTTERPEALKAGTVKLVGTDHEKIVSGVSGLLEDKGLYDGMSKSHNPYGDGSASSRIIETMEHWFKENG